MIFKDYYSVLGVDINSTFDEIKLAYRQQSRKWHPDRNVGVNTTQQMQDINEAYEILKDEVKRQKYNEFYIIFKEFNKTSSTDADTSTTDKSSYDNNYREYRFDDLELENWIKEAREKASKLAVQLKSDTVGSLKSGVKEAGKTISNFVIIWGILIGVAIVGSIVVVVINTIIDAVR